jgi:hypothetical protein
VPDCDNNQRTGYWTANLARPQDQPAPAGRFAEVMVVYEGCDENGDGLWY